MKINKILMGLGAVAALSLGACSNDEPANTGNNPGDAEFGDQYLSVSIMMPTANGGRAEGVADNDSDKYTDGTEAESKVSNIVFFFFDNNNNVVDIQKFDDPKFEKGNPFNPNPFVTSYGTKEVRLKSGLNYSQVAVVLNSQAKDASSLISQIKTFDDLLDRQMNYASMVETDGTMQVMSNSVFYNTTGRDVVPTADKKYILVPITEENIYKSTDRLADGSLPEGKKYVDIFVERVASKVTVATSLNMDKYYTSEEGVKTITLYNNVTLTTEEVVIKPEILGVTLNVLSKKASLIKNMTHDQVGYNNEIANGFLWNDPMNMRSYWATTPSYGKEQMQYYSWNDVNGKGLQGVTNYINPNTQDYEVGKENNSLNTKVMVVAQLFAYDKADKNYENPKPIDLVRFGSEYMESSNALAHTANLANVAVRSINWDMLGKDYTAAEIEVLKVVVPNAFVTGLGADKFEFKADLKARDRFDTYSAVVATVEGFDYEIPVVRELFNDYNLEDEEADAALKELLANDADLAALIAKAKEQTITPAIDDVVNSLNTNQNILYWKDGKTYYYTTIRQQGFYGLTGTGDNYLNGVVRNHIYNVTLEGIYGLGTPVIEPGMPIDPERPTIDRPSYLQARINILPWRIVTNSATIH